MREARLLVEKGDVGYYHCMSRVVDRRFIFGPEEKEFFVSTLRKVAHYHGVEVLTYCVMGNHFHVLVEVPGKGLDWTIEEAEVLERVEVLYGKFRRRELEQQLGWARDANDEAWGRELLERFTSGMGELQYFMKMLKQRFTMWYNSRKGRKGTLWEERYKSVLVEGSGMALLACAAYIDLNPVRAKLVEDPKDYRWSGYGAAVSGVALARQGIGVLVSLGGGKSQWKYAGKEYRTYVFKATEPQMDSASKLAGIINAQNVRAVIAQGGQIPMEEILRVRVRYFADGLVLGSKDYVEKVFQVNRKRFGKKRRSGARPMRGADWGGLFVMRDLRREIFG